MALTEDIVRTLPRATGVYLLRDAPGRIIYIGKAKDLRGRLRSYLGRDDRINTARIVEATQTADYILTLNEAEALLLENQMIKAHKPRYNIDLKDDKTYVRIKVSTGSMWPAISITRKVVSDGSRYFGPFSSALATRRTLSAIGRIFPIRRCKDTEFANRSRPCIYHSIGLCLAPCVHKHIRSEYDQAVNDLIAFLEGRDKDLRRVLTARMEAESGRLEFEKAAKIRDQIEAIKTTLVPQVVVGQARGDSHVFATFKTPDHVQVAVLQMEKGTLVDSLSLSFREASDEDLMAAIVLQFYLGDKEIPGTIYLDTLPHDRETLEEVMGELRGGRVRIVKPSRGRPLQWMAMARENARTHARENEGSPLEEIAKAFHLGSIPYRMECYDISTLQGESSAASRVVFVGGEPDKALYRHYRIRTVAGQDDFAMLREVFERRLGGDDTRPDLIVIDGGKGQLGVFLRVMEDLGHPGIPVAAMAKARYGDHDRFFLPGRKDTVRLPERSAGLRMLQLLRDETHRFALKYHRQLRSRESASFFEQITGIGPKKAKALLKLTAHLKDPSRMTAADLEGVRGLSRRDIHRILEYLADRSSSVS
jgi:excinuclease ABC subunit C